ncbi:hypothetical protein TVAG_051990 [Trichomonas vaginalis G3]|uniref:Uncharacterized protein n=1 Tax=Trichomonas vaginalis (strain ATCC PRA-98 / G3) TaxID=412133 RepID=A2F4J5_TRIV3|nr:hypothetical protein TVAGG3_0047180 [Trichomonas vaginalis G3]EAY00151.1 hypothetical protein TVAG_051990 [Trichomonas vaginalis G3]KAI5541116.1 hypothetical protein TVAGG3_0047180 [Trichomonas vaginalis G3]|eukprot:XP_001313080.1 hypothetical protein [Trichomonas vaginalis G3]
MSVVKETDTMVEKEVNTTSTTYIDQRQINTTYIIVRTTILEASKTYYTETIITFVEMAVDVRVGGLTSTQLILIAVFSMFMLFCLAIIGLFLYRHSRNEASEDSLSSETQETDFSDDNEPTRANITDIDNTIETVNNDNDFDEDDNYMNNMDF